MNLRGKRENSKSIDKFDNKVASSTLFPSVHNPGLFRKVLLGITEILLDKVDIAGHNDIWSDVS